MPTKFARSIFSYLLLTVTSLMTTPAPGMDSFALTSRYFDFEGYKTHYVEAGAGQKMVFLHNGGTSHRIWEHQLKHFAERYHVFALDNLGFGESEKPDIDYPLDLHIRQLAAFLDHIDGHNIVLVGHCMGGAMALNYTAANPERIEKLILCNIYTEQTLLAGVLAPQYRKFSTDPKALAERIVEDKATKGRNAYSDDPMSNVALTRVIARADSFGISDSIALPDGMPPTMLIWGEQNPVVPISAGKALNERLQFDVFEPLPMCKHMAMLEEPELFIQKMEQFLISEEERGALLAVDEYFNAFNARDPERFAKSLHYPHMRVAGNGAPTLWHVWEDFAARTDFNAIATKGNWERTNLDWKRAIQTGKDKVHVMVGYTRYNPQKQPILSEESLYVVTRRDGRWAIQMRSSFLEEGMATARNDQ